VLLGVIAIASSRVEEVEELRARLQAACQHIDPERLLAAPDCGLGLLGRDLTRAKLKVLAAAAHSL
jgi:5-methyltetrahydropteroyltriglutamate--homocysteine methyltransferase